ncbi:M16 family metallopeptidase [Sphingomonas floccifaciens]|uniref:M16 family metallopeptidase n=1 Tax=Sphingomonas floccifaciens TaxID=1844115 RepID=A0ABW4NF48_9SPHN
MKRRCHFALLPLVAIVAQPLVAQTVPSAPPRTSPAPLDVWLHQGSDIPADPAWMMGTLPNGLRYAVRRNATPPGTVAIRVRIDAGALMEPDDEQGWAHLLEHMAFRGTPTRPDGEAVKLWQRLGASFGSDSNAATSYRATTYMLDLPRNDAPSLDEAMGTLADMMQNAAIDPKLLDIERKVVLAERAARMTPLVTKVRAATREVMQAGMLAGRRELAGTEATLAGATAERLRAFHKRWYRPERAVVVVAGDADPAEMVARIKRQFGGWKGAGKPPSEPAYGSPIEPPSRIALVTDGNVSAGLQVVWVTPHVPGKMTAERQRAQYLDTIALGVLNQRLGNQARSGGPMLSAGASLSRQRNMSDTVSLNVNVRGTQWKEALAEAYGVLNRALAGPIEQAEIDQQATSAIDGLRRSVETSKTWPSAAWANSLVSDVDTDDVSAPRPYYADLFAAQKPSLTPAAVGAALKTLFAPEPRVLRVSATPIEGGKATVAAALEAARKTEGGAVAAVRTVTLDMVSPPLPPGKVVGERPIAEFGIDRVEFANGVELVMKKTDYARESVSVDVRIGTGLSGRPANTRAPDWSNAVLAATGIGDVTPPELARLAAGRQLGFAMTTRSDATVLTGTTNPRDVGDLLRMMLGGATRPVADDVALGRFRAAYGATLRSALGQPQSVLSLMGSAAIHGGDTRFLALPQPREVQSTDVAAIRAHWSKLLAEGPVRVSVVGDFDKAAVIRAVAATFGALPARAAAVTKVDPIPPLSTARPLVLTHRGDLNQAVVAVVWRTVGGLDNLKAGRALQIATAVLRDRLTDDFRETQGGTYSPFVNQEEQRGFDGFGSVMAGAQLTPDRIRAFRETLDRIVADLAANGPSADSLLRAKETAVGNAQRAMASNAYWSVQLSGDLNDPRRLESIRTYVSGHRAVDAAAVRDVVKRYLADAKPLVIEVRPAPARPVIEVRPVPAEPAIDKPAPATPK